MTANTSKISKTSKPSRAPATAEPSQTVVAFPARRAAGAPKPEGARWWTGGFAGRIALAAPVAVGVATAAWYGSTPPVPIPPPRPVIAAAPAKPTPATPQTSVRTAAPAPAVAPPAPIESATMTAAQEAAFDGWLTGAYRRCWTAPKTTPEGETYLPKIRVAYKADGALSGPPRLVNPPSDPAWRPHADAALRAVKACDPLRVPEKYAPYYRQWKTRTLYFDPAAR
jgi:hypothetical protein